MDKIVYDCYFGGISLQFMDDANSEAVPVIANEMYYDCYGLEQVTLTSEDTVIDVGANVGMFSIYVKKKFGCKVIAFEPMPNNFENLKQNILLNGLKLEDFELHNVAITDTDGGFIEIGEHGYNSGGCTIFYEDYACENVSGVVKCPTETLGKYIDDRCKYLKVDTEGAEFIIMPTIFDKLSNIKYLGIEYHAYKGIGNSSILHMQIREHFDGQIFYSLGEKDHIAIIDYIENKRNK